MQRASTKWLAAMAAILMTPFVQPYRSPAQEKAAPLTKEEKKEEQKPFELPLVTVTAPEQDYVATQATTGTKTDTPLIETPQSISVVTSKQMEDQNVSSLAEALRYTPSVQAEPFGFEPRLTFIQIRGFDVSQFGLYRDGLQVANPGFNALGFASFNFEPYGMERIDILKGPASILYGQGNPGGLVNMASKRPTLRSFGEVRFEPGNFDRWQGKFDLGGPIDGAGKFSFRLTGLGRDSDTQVDFIENQRVFIAPAFSWRPTENTSLTILGHYQWDETKTSQGMPAAGTLFRNPNGKVPTRRFTGEPDVDRYDRDEFSLGYLFEHKAGDIWTFRQNFRYYRNELDHVQIYNIGLQADQRTINRGLFASDGHLDVFTVDTHAQAEFKTGPLTHTMLGGIDYQHADTSAFQGFATAVAFGGTTPPLDIFAPVYGSPVPMPPRFQNSAFQEQIGLYLQEQMKYNAWTLLLNGRYDWAKSELVDRLFTATVRQNDRKFTGRAGLMYRFAIGLAPYFSYSRSFLPAIGRDASGQPFKPESGEQYEVGLKYQPDGVKSFATLSLFQLTRENFLQTDVTNPPFFAAQTGEVRSRGIELEGVADLGFGLNLIGSYTYLDTEITKSNTPGETGERPTQIPGHMASLWGTYTVQDSLLKGFGVGAGVRYLGSTYGDVPNTVKVPGVTLADAAIYYAWKGVRLQVNAHNVFDKEYVSAAFAGGTRTTFGPRRTVTGSIGYRW